MWEGTSISWSRHQEGKVRALWKEGKVNQDEQDSVFHTDLKKTPPDQMNLLSEIIKQMTIQMKNLKTITKIS